MTLQKDGSLKTHSNDHKQMKAMLEVSWFCGTPSIKSQIEIYFSLKHREVNLRNIPLSFFLKKLTFMI